MTAGGRADDDRPRSTTTALFLDRVETDALADRERVAYRFTVATRDGRFVVEQPPIPSTRSVPGSSQAYRAGGVHPPVIGSPTTTPKRSTSSGTVSGRISSP